MARLAATALSNAAAGESAFWLLSASKEAFQSRVALFDAATQSLDVQYFIWRDDLTSWYLLQRLLAAADRGVRVRLIVDDVSASARDRQFFALTQHPNVEVRTFNPFRARMILFQASEFIVRSGTLNHRMHNKTILVDGHIGIIGGRNIGDRYFGVYEKFIQYDLDVMFSGAILEDARDSFDEFWNSPYAVAIEGYLRPRRRVAMSLKELRGFLDASVRAGEDLLVQLTDGADRWLAAQAARARLAPASFLFDSANIDDIREDRIKDELYEFLAAASREIVIATAYLIPDDELLRLLTQAADRGIRTVVLTNSVQSNNHMLAHVAYKRFRRRLLRSGIELYELRPDAALLLQESVPPASPGYLGLHTKAVVVDGRHALVGTANFDPRALDINTEAAIVIDHEGLAAKLRTQILEAAAPRNAWRLSLDERGRVRWSHDSQQRHNEPVRGPWQRVMQFLHVLLPIKGQA